VEVATTNASGSAGVGKSRWARMPRMTLREIGTIRRPAGSLGARTPLRWKSVAPFSLRGCDLVPHRRPCVGVRRSHRIASRTSNPTAASSESVHQRARALAPSNAPAMGWGGQPCLHHLPWHHLAERCRRPSSTLPKPIPPSHPGRPRVPHRGQHERSIPGVQLTEVLGAGDERVLVHDSTIGKQRPAPAVDPNCTE